MTVHSQAAACEELVPGDHGREILAACFLSFGEKLALVTGSEDTTVMIGEVNGLAVRNRRIVQTHIGSVRALAKRSVQDGFLVASAGSKTEIHLLQIDENLVVKHVA